MKKILGRIIEYIGYLLVVATYVLFYLTKKKMGVQRDFIFRNKKWMDTIFTGASRYIMLIVVAVALLLLILKLTRDKRSMKNLHVVDLIFSLLLGCSFVLFLNTHLVSFVGLPMLLVSIFVIFTGRVIRTPWNVKGIGHEKE